MADRATRCSATVHRGSASRAVDADSARLRRLEDDGVVQPEGAAGPVEPVGTGQDRGDRRRGAGPVRPARDLYVRHGPTGKAPTPWLFTELPSQEQWHEALAAQTRLTVSADEAARIVVSAWNGT